MCFQHYIKKKTLWLLANKTLCGTSCRSFWEPQAITEIIVIPTPSYSHTTAIVSRLNCLTLDFNNPCQVSRAGFLLVTIPLREFLIACPLLLFSDGSFCYSSFTFRLFWCRYPFFVSNAMPGCETIKFLIYFGNRHHIPRVAVNFVLPFNNLSLAFIFGLALWIGFFGRSLCSKHGQVHLHPRTILAPIPCFTSQIAK